MDPTLHNSIEPLVPMKPDEIFVATTAAKTDLWPRQGPQLYFAIAGLLILAFGITGALLKRVGVSFNMATPSAILMAVVGLGFGLWVAIRAIRRARLYRKPGSKIESTPDVRLMVIGPAAATTELLAEVANVAFEPVVMRSVYAISRAKRAKDGTIVTRRRKKTQVRTELASAKGGKAAFIICAILCVGTVGVLHLFVFARSFTFNYFEVLAGLAAGAGLAAFIRPTYIRLAPGTLDVFHYGVLGMGTPVVERYDLRQTRVHVHAENHYVRLLRDDLEGKPVLYFDLRRLMGGTTPRGRAFLLAALSTHPTPPMPADSLD